MREVISKRCTWHNQKHWIRLLSSSALFENHPTHITRSYRGQECKHTWPQNVVGFRDDVGMHVGIESPHGNRVSGKNDHVLVEHIRTCTRMSWHQCHCTLLALACDRLQCTLIVQGIFFRALLGTKTQLTYAIPTPATRTMSDCMFKIWRFRSQQLCATTQTSSVEKTSRVTHHVWRVTWIRVTTMLKGTSCDGKQEQNVPLAKRITRMRYFAYQLLFRIPIALSW